VAAQQHRAVADLTGCRTARLGGRIEQCSACGAYEYHYRSCGNRHCPKCQAGSRAAWLQREAGYLLPVEYHHLVFTLPQELAPLALGNPRLIYALLFEAASACVLELAADPRHLGAQVGLTAVLHTWGQTLTLHPHLHVLATGGGLSCDAGGTLDEEPAWRGCRPGFFLPVRVLGRLFRGKFLAGLRRAYEQGRLLLAGEQAALAEQGAWALWLGGLYRQDWVVYSQPPCAGPEVVLKYLARYVCRVAISNSRLVAASDEAVTFTYKDYRRGGKQRRLTLGGPEFARRFLQHVLPRGFVRVRHYGLLANRSRERRLAWCRRLLLSEGARQRVQAGAQAPKGASAPAGPRRGPACGQGEMRVVQVLAAQPTGEDTS
jgi:hypothetical protein